MKKILLLAIIFLMIFPFLGAKAQVVGETATFNVDPDFDADKREKVLATMVKTTYDFYFYVEKGWWDMQGIDRQNEVLRDFDAVSLEFHNTIYPKLTSVYGSEPRPGIDNDNRITLLFEQTRTNLGGYFRSKDEYSKLQVSDSNEREMLYMPISQISSPQLKVFLAHEFVHLITFNQKDNAYGVTEEVWLSEARSDFASTILGYDDIYQGSNLNRRFDDFLDQPGDPLTEWQNTKYDYAIETMFTHYLVDHYGLQVLTDSLKSKLVGIPSLNEALSKNRVRKDFAQIFTDWTITVIINNCSKDINYCYINKNLVNLRINPTLIFLPLTGSSSLSLTNTVKNWAGTWQKIIGGNGNLTLQFSGVPGLNFQLPYLVYDKSNNYTISFLKIDAKGKAQVEISNFGAGYNSLVIIPSLQSKIGEFDGPEISYPYTLTISISKTATPEDPVLMQKLQDQITLLKKQIADALAKQQGGSVSMGCSMFNDNLYIGLQNSRVICLQEFLKLQGTDIYPEGFVTGFFGILTKTAVIRFQKKYSIAQTGFVGVITRQKINSLIAP